MISLPDSRLLNNKYKKIDRLNCGWTMLLGASISYRNYKQRQIQVYGKLKHPCDKWVVLQQQMKKSWYSWLTKEDEMVGTACETVKGGSGIRTWYSDRVTWKHEQINFKPHWKNGNRAQFMNCLFWLADLCDFSDALKEWLNKHQMVGFCSQSWSAHPSWNFLDEAKTIQFYAKVTVHEHMCRYRSDQPKHSVVNVAVSSNTECCECWHCRYKCQFFLFPGSTTILYLMEQSLGCRDYENFQNRFKSFFNMFTGVKF